MQIRRNYYRLLHVQPDAPGEIIRSSYRTVMQKMRAHPDLGGDERHAAIINEAYATLSDPRARAEYDKTRLKSQRTEATPEKIAYTSRRPRIQRSVCAFCEFEHRFRERMPENAACLDCHSPLIPAKLVKVEEDCRRAINRIAKEHPIAFYTHWPQTDPFPARSDDISLNGMKFYSRKSVDANQIIKIDCQILKAVARVTHSQQCSVGWGVGVQFLNLSFEEPRGSLIAVRA